MLAGLLFSYFYLNNLALTQWLSHLHGKINTNPKCVATFKKTEFAQLWYVFAFTKHKAHQMLTFRALKPNLLYVLYSASSSYLYILASSKAFRKLSGSPFQLVANPGKA